MACIGNGHPDVKQAIKDQVDKLSCGFAQGSSFETIPTKADF